jgi:hypothetical protein
MAKEGPEKLSGSLAGVLKQMAKKAANKPARTSVPKEFIDELRSASETLSKAQREFDLSHAQTKAKSKALETAQGKVNEAVYNVLHGYGPLLPLPGDKKPDAAPAAKPAEPAKSDAKAAAPLPGETPLPKGKDAKTVLEDKWRGLKLRALDGPAIRSTVIEKLEVVGIVTVGDLVDKQAKYPNWKVSDVAGIGPSAVAMVDRSLEALWERLGKLTVKQ